MRDFDLATIKASHLGALSGVSDATALKWGGGREYIPLSAVQHIPEVYSMLHSAWEEEDTSASHLPSEQQYTSLEFFAGAGGLALGLERAGFRSVGLVEVDPNCCDTLRCNRPEWTVIQADINSLSAADLRSVLSGGSVDLLSGGFPCQAFSYAGKQGGFGDARGTLFFEMARLAKELQPKVLLCENVKGLRSHDGGKTYQTILQAIKDIGYTIVAEPKVLKAVMYKVPQRRERLFIVAVRNDLAERASFAWPSPYHRVMTLQDAFFRGELYDADIPESEGARYPKAKARVMARVPMGGNWRDLPVEMQRAYMGKSFSSGGGRTGMARRLDYGDPSLTLTCSPSQKQTERAHPEHNRPLTVREYARIQTFPDEWTFCGTLSSRYAQIGNAVPVNLARAVGSSLIRLLDSLH